MQRAKDDPGVEKFLEYFYKSCIETLFKPFSDIPEFRQLQSEILFLTLTLVTNFTERTHPPYVEGTNKFVPLSLRSAVQFCTPTFFPQPLLPTLLQRLHPSRFPPFIPRQASVFGYASPNTPLWLILMRFPPAAFRFFRICLRINNRNLFNHLIKLDVLQPIVDLAVKESVRDNLISSSCQEFFDHLRKVCQ